jgi:hypothetical protein
MLQNVKADFESIANKAHLFVKDIFSRTESEFMSLRNDIISLHTAVTYKTVSTDFVDEKNALVSDVKNLLSSLEEYWRTRFDPVPVAAPVAEITPSSVIPVESTTVISNESSTLSPNLVTETDENSDATEKAPDSYTT